MTLTLTLIGVNCRATSAHKMAFGNPGQIIERSRGEPPSSPVTTAPVTRTTITTTATATGTGMFHINIRHARDGIEANCFLYTDTQVKFGPELPPPAVEVQPTIL